MPMVHVLTTCVLIAIESAPAVLSYNYCVVSPEGAPTTYHCAAHAIMIMLVEQLKLQRILQYYL